jgi:cyclopropane-fatty-acyl-phospholipid synthase
MKSVLTLSNLPLTGYYVHPKEAPIEAYHFDQNLLICLECGHGQLENIIDPQYLYNDKYSHRGSLSPIASGGNYFFLNYLLANISGKKESIIDVGCNDLLLIELIKKKVKADNYYGLDPIWIGMDQIKDGINVLGKFSNELTPTDIKGKLDLVVSCHTFEHIPDPIDSLTKISELCSDNADFFIEVPSFETLAELNRVDQVFHQHVNYYSVNSMTELFKRFGFGYVDHTFNYDMWGGTMILHFRKGHTSTHNSLAEKMTPEKFLSSLSLFRKQIIFFNEQIASFDDVCLYGAAQMLPILLYHLNNDMLNSITIYDNNPNRIGLKYPYLELFIQEPPKSLAGKTIVITALDSFRPIFKKLVDLHPKRIIDILTIK